MFTVHASGDAATQLVLSQLTPVHLAAFAAAIPASMPYMESIGKSEKIQKALWASSLVLLLACMLNLAGGTYNPFIYFRF